MYDTQTTKISFLNTASEISESHLKNVELKHTHKHLFFKQFSARMIEYDHTITEILLPNVFRKLQNCVALFIQS